MYESPIEKIVQHIQENLIKQEEDHLMAQITETVGYQINKEELIKALRYDRNQYHIGFEDARKMYERAKGEWIMVAGGSLIDDYRCSCCGNYPPKKQVNVSWGWDFTVFCPHCGAEMRQNEEEAESE